MPKLLKTLRVSTSDHEGVFGQGAKERFASGSTLELAFRVLAEAAHPNVADAVAMRGVPLNPVCQEELYDPEREVSINPN